MVTGSTPVQKHVHRHQRRARLLAGLGAFHGGDVVGIPALAHFYGDRALSVRHHLLHDAPAAVGVQHQLAARPAGNVLKNSITQGQMSRQTEVSYINRSVI